MNTRPNIVLIHGAWADGSSWSGVIERLQADGYHVTAPQFPLTALADDVARLRQVLDLQDGPTIIAGHSYGGQVVTALGPDAPNVAGLVYIAAFGLDQGESVGGLLWQGPVTPALAHLFTDTRGFSWLSEDDFVNHFAADVDPVQAKVMYAVQQPLVASAFGDVMGVPAWKRGIHTASEQVLEVMVRRHVFESERPFQAVLDGIYGGVSQPASGCYSASSRRARRTSSSALSSGRHRAPPA
jgi:pimeloyl-ACP methyl ester carboxylesterase